jgi:predicted site-specific integrase-resolvase
MRSERGKTALRCAVYTRVSTEHGLEQEFNSLDNQREASEAYVKSQSHEGWKLIRIHYDDGGYSGGSMDRPALKRLLDDVRARRIDVIVVYKVDRLTRSLADFAKLPIPMKPPVYNGMIAPRDSWMMPPPCNEMIPPGAPRLLA